MGRWLRRVRPGHEDRERGAVLVFVSIAMVVLIGSAALAVDIGQMTSKNRSLQAVADAVALDAARALGGQTVSQLSAPGGAFMTALNASATRNNFAPGSLTVEFGALSPGWVAKTNSGDVPTAVRVKANGTTDFAFRPGSSVTSRAATAVMGNSGGFSIGSWLASIPAGEQGVLNALLGDAFHLNAVSYTGLVDANLTLEAIGAEIPAGVLSPTELLNTSVSVHDFMVASIAALTEQGNTAAASVLQNMINATTTVGSIRLGDTVAVEPGGETAAATAALNVLQLIQASALVAEKNSGHALSIPTTSISIPGLASVTASATIIEPPQIYFGPAGGPTVETAQVRLSVRPVLNLALGVPGVLSVTVNGALPLDLTAAGATGQLTAVNCATPSITVASTTQAVNLNAGVSLDLGVKVLFLPPANLARLSVAAGAKTTANNYSTTFNSPSEFGPSNAKSVGSSALGLNGLLNITNANLTALGVVNLSAVAGLVVPAVNTLLGSLDSALIVPLTKTLGLKLGGADIAALEINCNGLRLAE